MARGKTAQGATVGEALSWIQDQTDGYAVLSMPPNSRLVFEKSGRAIRLNAISQDGTPQLFEIQKLTPASSGGHQAYRAGS